ncbi:MAG: hypothetical protein MUP85_18860 [Candidatus Lokiarchaeota archaeon]|nr:hypothetical protein [Candidatus Lokiarchaeota archaeon]
MRNLNLRFKKIKIKLELLKKKNKVKLVGYKTIDFDKNFSKIYKGKMRFDGYTEIIIKGQQFKIAFEYNGFQHYEFPNYWFKDSLEGYKVWIRYVERDQIKKEICKSNNIILIEFPHYLDRALEHPNKIRSYIINKFESATGQTLE